MPYQTPAKKDNFPTLCYEILHNSGKIAWLNVEGISTLRINATAVTGRSSNFS